MATSAHSTASRETVLVTGAASGLGAATATLLATRFNVVLTDLNEADGEALAARLGPNALFMALSVTERDTIHAACKAAIQKFGGLHAVVNCAGVGGAMKTVSRGEPHDPDYFKFVLEVNLFGTFNVASIAASYMCKQPANADGSRGVIINVASVAAFDGQKGQLAYSASKGAVAAMALPMARDLARHGIRVVTIAPGIFDTPMMSKASKGVRESLLKDVVAPHRFGKASEFALLAQSIIDNPYLNALTIRIDAGIRMSNL